MKKSKIDIQLSINQTMSAHVIVAMAFFFLVPCACAYEVLVGLGSTAGVGATIAMGDRNAWPVVAEFSWGPLANLVPISRLKRNQQKAVFYNFKHRRAIAELTYRNVRWTESQPDMDFLRSFGLSIPYVFVLDESQKDSMLTRAQIVHLKRRFPGKTIIMNSRSWTRDNGWLNSVADVLDAVCIEFMPHNTPDYIAKDVAPYAVWAHNHNKILMLLMPPLPDDYRDDRFVKAVTLAVQTIYEANKNILPHGWMKSDKIMFVPANYTWTATNKLQYVPETARNSVLAAAKSLLMMRPRLDAGPVYPVAEGHIRGPISLLLHKENDD